MERCFKCNKQKKPGSLFLKWGAAFYICDECPIDSIDDSKLMQKTESQIRKNIRQAKERRESGLSPWNKPENTAI
jgi:hypothetical protein